MKIKSNILAICGSTRINSANINIIHAISEIDKDKFSIDTFDIATLPFFNQDIKEDQTPKSVIDFRNAILKADGVIICTPEYVFSLPGILKNA